MRHLQQVFHRLRSRSVLPPLLPGEQLGPRHAGRPLPVRVPVRPAALLAVRVPWDSGSGEPLSAPAGLGERPGGELVLGSVSSAS